MVVKVHNFFRSRSQSVVDESKLGAGVLVVKVRNFFRSRSQSLMSLNLKLGAVVF